MATYVERPPNSVYPDVGETIPMALPMGTAMPAIGGAPGSGMEIFQNDAISVEQTMRGCLQECFGCEVSETLHDWCMFWRRGLDLLENSRVQRIVTYVFTSIIRHGTGKCL